MSYCQKHKNHHCVNSHNCSDPNHKKKASRGNSTTSKPNCKSTSTIIHTKYKPPLGTIQDNEQCEFQYQSPTQQESNLTLQSYLKKISSLGQQLQLSKRCQLNAEIENRKLKLKNSHVECQIQYLRSQLDLLVSNHNTDIGKEISKHIKENTSLNIKIKQLMTAVFDKEKAFQEIGSENYSLGRKNKQYEETIRNLEEKIKLICSKNQQISSSNTSISSKLKQTESSLKLLKQRYSTLSSSIDSSSKHNSEQTSHLASCKQKLQKSYKAKESQNKKLKQLHDIEKKAWQKIIQELKSALQKKQQQTKQYHEVALKYQENLVQVKDDFQHAKKLILKYEKVNKECQKIRVKDMQNESFKPDDSDQIGKKTVLKPHPSHQPSSEQKSRLNLLQNQNLLLRNQIKELQLRLTSQRGPLQNKTNIFNTSGSYQAQNVIVNEELILSIGASEQLKKIVQQKNSTIKQLMREKAILYNKIYEQQAGRP